MHSVRDAYVNMGKAITFGDLDILSAQFGAFLQTSCGLKKGDRIAIMMPNCLQYPIAVHGALRAGHDRGQHQPAVHRAGARASAGGLRAPPPSSFSRTSRTCCRKSSRHTPIKHIVVTSVGEMLGFPKGPIVDFVVRHKRKQVKPFSLPGAKTFRQALKEGTGVRMQAVKLTHDDIAFLQYTGGTTGVAKGAMLTHGNMVSNVLAGARVDQPRVSARSADADHRAAAVSHLRVDR